MSYLIASCAFGYPPEMKNGGPMWNRRFCLTYGMHIIKDHLKGQMFCR